MPPTLTLTLPSPSSVVGSRAWLAACLAGRHTLHAVPEYETHGAGAHLLRLELRAERDGKQEKTVLTILCEDGSVHPSTEYEGLPVLSAGALADLRAATEGLLTRLRAAADVSPVRLALSLTPA